MTCLSCHATTTNGLALCDACRVAASVYLEFLPVYFRNLARWNPGRAGSRDVPGSREPRGLSVITPRVPKALDEAGAALVSWAKSLTDDRGIEPPPSDSEVEQAAVLCRWFTENLTTIATLEWCGEFMRQHYPKGEEGDGIGYHHDRLLELTHSVVPGWYAGACHLCQTNTYVIPGLSWVTCGGCGATTYARDHLETIIEEARGWVAPPMRLAEAIVALVDTELSVPRLHKRISKWGERGRIPVLRKDDYAPKKYRLGDVLDALLTEGETRLDDSDAVKAC